MYHYFVLLNVFQAAYTASQRGAIDEATYRAHLNNIANLTCNDSEFISQHVLPRGYTDEFRQTLQHLWTDIRTRGTLRASDTPVV
jgi:hypothetical protein